MMTIDGEERVVRMIGNDRIVMEVEEEERAGNPLTPQRKVVMIDAKNQHGERIT